MGLGRQTGLCLISVDDKQWPLKSKLTGHDPLVPNPDQPDTKFIPPNPVFAVPATWTLSPTSDSLSNKQTKRITTLQVRKLRLNNEIQNLYKHDVGILMKLRTAMVASQVVCPSKTAGGWHLVRHLFDQLGVQQGVKRKMYWAFVIKHVFCHGCTKRTLCIF